ncbi:MAG: hypothetical protein KUG70_12115 [Rhodobacteraceae bacterium]|nr:hypothetical protein [Paracoccaceae bacterium]
MRKQISTLLLASLAVLFATATTAQVTTVLWWDGSPSYPGSTDKGEHQKLAAYIGDYNGDKDFSIVFQNSQRAGDFAAHMQGHSYNIIVFDSTSTKAHMTQADLDAFRQHYKDGKRALMMDGTLWIRSTRDTPLTIFPGPNGSSAALLINQITAIADAGGGILIGTDHSDYQVGANQVLGALVPKARFSGTTNPSRDGDFLGDILLRSAKAVRPIDILRHWEAIPSQGQAPVGNYTDFLGNPVTFYSLVETSDKPGGRKKRPYISASFDPGQARTAIDSEIASEPEVDHMPTRKSPASE